MEELISKKELLKLTNISYGQLYRWKRMNIIPEDWFIKKYSPTGQETYFNKNLILERIEFILSKKDEISLEEIAAMLNKTEEYQEFTIADIEDDVVSQYAKEIFASLTLDQKNISSKELFVMAIIEKYLIKSVISLEELKIMVNLLEENSELLNNNTSRLYLFRKFGVSFVMGAYQAEEIKIEKAAVKILDLKISDEIKEIKDKIK